MAKTFRRPAVLAAFVLLGGACTVKQQEGTSALAGPALAGPSELGLSLSITATPDRLTQDGVSQSEIRIQAFGPNGPIDYRLLLRVDMVFAGALQDFGQLSTRNVPTDLAGRATVTYTAPPPPSVGQQTVTIRVVPVPPDGGDATAAFVRTVDIRLVPAGTNLQFPTASFSFSPFSPVVGQGVVFNATNSCPGPITSGVCQGSGSITAYAWTFGDGATGTGVSPTHPYASTGTYTVKLTVTNNSGGFASTTQTVVVAAATAPTAAFEISPTAPVVADTITFNASTSTAAAGRTIASYTWDWGDGSALEVKTSAVTTHKYAAAETSYTVVLVVTDDVGATKSVTKAVTVLP